MGEPALELDLGGVPETPAAAAAAPVLTGTAAVLDALIKHYRKPGTPRDGEILIPEPEAPGTGRRCDLVRMSMWRSRGQGIDGHEIKISRGDWLRELDEPAKADAWWPYCTRWWIVTPPGLVRDGELPPGWGLLEVPARGRRFKVRVAATAKEPKLTVPLIAELMRRADNQRLNELDALRTRHRRDLFDAEHRFREQAAEATLTPGQQARLELLDKLEEALGCTITGWAYDNGRTISRLTAAELAEVLKDAKDTAAAVRRAKRNDRRELDLRQTAQAVLQQLDVEGAHGDS